MEQRIGRFLARFEMQVLAVCLNIIAEVTCYGDNVAKQRIGRIVRDKTKMQGNRFDSKQPGEIGNLLHLLKSCRPCFGRDETDRFNIWVS